MPMKFKRLTFDTVAREKILTGATALADAVRVTLGPKSKAVLIEKEWGDLIFSLVNLGRHLKLDSERSTHRAIDGFIERFSKVEDKAKETGRDLSELTVEEMDVLWEEVKLEGD